jgi:hypothetical protein
VGEWVRGRIIALFLPALLFVTILSGCTSPAATMSTPEPIERSFLTDEPCAAPCWYGLIPGKSTKADAHRVLAEMPFVDQATIREGSTGFYMGDATAVTFRCPRQPSNRICGSIVVYGNTVQEIDLEPQWGAESSGYMIDLYYVQRGIIARRVAKTADRYISWSDGNSVVLAQEMQVSSLVYSPPAPSLRDGLTYRRMSPGRIEYLLEHLPAWPGWGKSVPMGP